MMRVKLYTWVFTGKVRIRAAQGRAGQHRTGQDRTGQDSTDKAWQHNAKHELH